MIERLRQVITASSRAAINASGVRSRGVYGAVAELARLYEMSPLELTQSELKAFSQNGEDGVLQEILYRAGIKSQTFAEFGIGDGTEGNCAFLAQVMGWKGVILEADEQAFHDLSCRYAHVPGVETVRALRVQTPWRTCCSRPACPSSPT